MATRAHRTQLQPMQRPHSSGARSVGATLVPWEVVMVSALIGFAMVVALVGATLWMLCRVIERNAPILDGDAALPPEA